MGIVGITKAALRTGCHPPVWKHTSGAVIVKPGKEDDTRLKSYRMISLLSFIGKSIEKVVAEQQSNKAEKRAPLSDGPFGSRNKRSAINAAAIMVDRSHSAWNEENIAGVLVMDIKAVFPSVVRGRLIQAMKATRIDGDLIPWTKTFLSARTVDIVVQGKVLQSHSVEAGVPQGLFPIHNAGLIQLVEERVQATSLCLIGDLGWVATGKDVNQVVKKLEACAVESIEWANREDLQFDTVKMDAALFTYSRGQKKHLGPKLTTKITVGKGIIRFSKQATWWLGVWMDAHLMFKEHHNHCREKAQAAEAQLRVLITMHGIVPERVLGFHIACV